ncbi:MAG: exodeoxyribonuclease VII small subunit [Bdellovibrionota bacterium]
MLENDLKKLEELAKKLEGELPLEEALKNFSEGVELVRACQKKIQEAELKVKEVLEKDGTLVEKPL